MCNNRRSPSRQSGSSTPQHAPEKARVNEILCKGCGACVAACPSGAMEQQGFKGNQLMAMIETPLGG